MNTSVNPVRSPGEICRTALLSLMIICVAAIIAISVVGTSDSDGLDADRTINAETTEGVDVVYLVLSDPRGETHGTVSVGTGNGAACEPSEIADTITIPSVISDEFGSYDVVSVNNSAFTGVKCRIVILPDSIVTIGNEAFGYNSYLTSITIPAGVETIGSRPFICDTALEEIDVDEENQAYESNGGVLFTKTKILTAYPIGKSGTSYQIPQNILSIDSYAFAYSELSSISIADSVLQIREYAFYECNSITSLSVPDSALIENGAFRQMKGLSEITVSENNTRYVSVDGVLYNKSITVLVKYPGKMAGTDYTIPSTVKELTVGAFDHSTNLKTIAVPTGLEVIGAYAFAGCTSLTSIEIPSTVTTIGGHTFEGDSGLTTAAVNATITAVPEYMFSSCTSLRNLTYPSAVTEICASAFAGTGLTSFVINDNITKIGSQAFSECSSLRIVEFGTALKTIEDKAFYHSGISEFRADDSLTKIGYSAFSKCDKLISVYLNDSLEEIGDYAFSESHLVSIELPASLITMGKNAFSGCAYLHDAVLAGTDLTIGEGSFRGCTNLMTLRLGSGVTMVGTEAFSGCTSLVTVIIGSSVSTLRDYAFAGCTGLRSVEFRPSSMTFGDSVFGDCIFYDSDGTTVLSQSDLPGHFYYGQTYQTLIRHSEDLVTVYYDTSFGTGSVDPVQIEPGEYVLAEYTGTRSGCNFAGWTDGDEIYLAGETVDVGRSLTFYAVWQRTDGSTVQETVDGHIILTYTVYSEPAGYLSGSLHLKDCKVITESDSVTKVTLSPMYLQGEYGTGYYVVEGIEKEAFKDVSGVDVSLPDTLIYIGSEAFFDCTDLSSPYISESLTLIGEGAFAGCTNIEEFFVDEANISYASYNGALFNRGNTIIYSCPINNDRTSFTLPSDTTGIDAYAFYKCRNIQTIDIPDTVTMIGKFAFAYSGLTEANIHNAGIGTLDGTKVTSYESTIFRYCSELTSITVGQYNPTLSSDNDGVMYDKNRTAIVCFPANSSITSFTILPTVITIRDYAFYGCKNLTTLNFNSESAEGIVLSKVANIGDYAFANCSNLDNVALPDSLMSLGEFVFSDSTGLTTVTLSNNAYVSKITQGMFSGCTALEEITYYTNVRYIEDKAFLGCASLESFAVYNAVIKIGDYAFADCTGLTMFNVNEGNLTEIGVYAFSNCTSLNAINLSSSVIKIGEYAFSGCTSLRNINLPSSMTEISDYLFYGCTGLSLVNIGQSVTSVGNYAFAECRNLPSLVLPSSIETIGSDAFENCVVLSTLVLPDSVKTLGDKVFYGCSLINVFTVPSSVKTMGTHVFEKCSNLSTVYFYAGVAEIPDYTFFECVSLMTLRVSDSVKTLGDHSFAGCTALSSLPVGNSVTKIGPYAFAGCSALASMSFTSSKIIELGEGAFSDCTGLTRLILSANIVTVGESVFKDCTELRNLTIPSGFNFISGHMFSGCSKLTMVYIPGSVSSIGNYAFSDCTGLSSITLSDGVVSIGEGAFSGCTAIIYVTVPDSVTSLGSSAFEGCSSLETLKLSSSITAISSHTFKGCTNLLSVTVPNGVLTMASEAFISCPSLKSVTVPSSVTSISADCFDSDIVFRSSSGDLPVSSLPGYTYTEKYEERVLYRSDTQAKYTITYYDDEWQEYKKEVKKYVPGEMVTMIDLPTVEGKVYVWTSEFTIVDNQIMMPCFDVTVKLEIAYLEYRLYLTNEGKVVIDEKIKSGDPVPEIPTPTKKGTQQYSYIFECWVDDDDNVVEIPETMSEDIIAKARYITVINKYTLLLYDDDAVTVLHTYTLEYGTDVPEIEDPKKEKTAEATYEFLGWVDSEGTTVAIPDVLYDDFTAFANYQKTINEYLIKYIDADLTTVLLEETLKYGSAMPILPDREKESTAQYTYKFRGWIDENEEVVIPTPTVVADMVVHAEFDEILNQYKVTFYTDTGSPVNSSVMDYGMTIQAIEGPAKDPDEYTYTFKSWYGFTEGMIVTKNESFYAEYERKLIIPESGDVTLDSKGQSYMLIDEGTVNDLKSKAGTDDVSLRTTVSGGEFLFDRGAILALSGSNVLSLSKVTDKSQQIKDLVGDSPVYEIDFGDNKQFGDGTVTVTLSYSLAQGKDPSMLKIYCIADAQISEKLDCTYSDGKASFDTGHFSTYAIVLESPEPASSGSDNTVLIAGIVVAVIVLLLLAFLIKRRLTS